MLGNNHPDPLALGQGHQPGDPLLPTGQLDIHKPKPALLKQGGEPLFILLWGKAGLSSLPLGPQGTQQGPAAQFPHHRRKGGKGVPKEAVQPPLIEVGRQGRDSLHLAEQGWNTLAGQRHAHLGKALSKTKSLCFHTLPLLHSWEPSLFHNIL